MKTQFIKRRLKEIKKDAGWLARECECSEVTMKQNYFRGIRPSSPVLKLMAQALGCTVSDLVHEDELEPAKVG